MHLCYSLISYPGGSHRWPRRWFQRTQTSSWCREFGDPIEGISLCIGCQTLARFKIRGICCLSSPAKTFFCRDGRYSRKCAGSKGRDSCLHADLDGLERAKGTSTNVSSYVTRNSPFHLHIGYKLCTSACYQVKRGLIAIGNI